jgi:LacI family transcriptional regulator
MTVSRVVNGRKYVGEETRQRVMAAVNALKYSPNLAGRSLRTSGAYKVGMLYSNPSEAYLNQFLVGALQQCSLTGSTLVIEQCGGLRSQRVAAEKLLAAKVDGVILPPPLCDSAVTLNHLEEEGIPAVAFATGRPQKGISSVRIDDYEAARAMTQHLIGLGHRDIGFIQGDPTHSPTVLRTSAFLAVMSEARLPILPEFMAQGLFTYRSGLAAAAQLLKGKRRPTAIFSSNDDMAAAVISVAHGLGLHVPEDLTVCGFDDTPVATIVWPELTTIHQPVANMARAAITLLLEEIGRRRAGHPSAGKHELMKFTLVKRASSAAPSKKSSSKSA